MKLLFILLLFVVCIGATYEERFELMRKQGEDEIKRRHELALEEKRIEVISRLQQLSSNEVVIHNDNSTGVVTEGGSISNTLTSSNSSTSTNNNTTSVK